MTDSSNTYWQIKIKKPVVKITERDIDHLLQQLRRQQAVWSPVTRGALLGDKIIAAYTGWIGGKKVIDSGNKPASIILGSNQLANKAQKSLVGTKAGDCVHAWIKHRKNDSNLSLAGNRVKYEYSVLEVLEEILPPIDKAFARIFGIKSGSLKSLRKQVKSILEHQVNNLVRRNIREQLIDGLLNANRVADTIERLDKQDALVKVLRKVVRENKITVDQDKVSAAIDAIAKQSENPEATTNKYITTQELFSKVEASVLENQVLDYVLAHSKVKEVPVSYRELYCKITHTDSVEADVASTKLPNLPIIKLDPDNKCDYCTRNCCTYVIQKIPSPRSKEDFSHLLWQVAHHSVEAFKDKEGWHLMFRSPCEHLQSDGRCGNYENRMQICRKYSNKYCEFDSSAEEGYEHVFKDYDSLLCYCKQRFTRWEY